TQTQNVQTLPDFTTLVEQNGPAVVKVRISRSAQNASDTPFPGLSEDDPFFEFFKRFGPPAQQQKGPAIQYGQGSGFIVSKDGTILTNSHVVDSATDILVKLTDKREFKAKVVGVDPRSDIAVLKIDAKDLPTVKIGNPDKIKVGEWVLAIGSPFGFENSVTSGIVSAKSRTLPDSNYVPFIQTDVPVNPGNSGGPLFNMKGEVIGVNSQIFSRTGGYMGLSFAIPIDVAMNVKDQLVLNGTVTRGRIGVQIQEVNQSLANSFGMEKPQGALVAGVEPGSPAQKAGLKMGDVILGINGEDIAQLSELPAKIAATKPGSEIRLDIWRDRARRSVNVTIGKLEEGNIVAGNVDKADGGKLGLAVRELTPSERAKLHIEGGVLVQDASGAAARAGIQPGDVILALNDTPVKSVEQLRELVGKSGKTIALLVQRNDFRTYVPVQIG
ncbi:MAG: DegQ family serine endoprotease, partial [Burkholderiales bacterium]